jgi:hypothetical protein
MAQGFVYIILNPDFPHLIKIGRSKNPEKRIKELQGTGVPKPYIRIYDEIVSDAAKVENRLHKRFAEYRDTNNREFFRIPVREAIRALQDETRVFPINPIQESNRVEILAELKQKYGNKIKDKIVAASIVQLPDVCYLEIVTRPFPKTYKDEIIEKIDLAVIGGKDWKGMFPTTDNVQTNAKRFVNELNELDLEMTTTLLQ